MRKFISLVLITVMLSAAVLTPANAATGSNGPASDSLSELTVEQRLARIEERLDEISSFLMYLDNQRVDLNNTLAANISEQIAKISNEIRDYKEMHGLNTVTQTIPRPTSLYWGEKHVSGKWEPGHTIYACYSYNGKEYSAVVNSKGKYKIKIAKLRSNECVELYEKDENGNKLYSSKYWID